MNLLNEFQAMNPQEDEAESPQNMTQTSTTSHTSHCGGVVETKFKPEIKNYFDSTY